MTEQIGDSLQQPPFEFTAPPELEGLTSQTILDLYEILHKYGSVSEEEVIINQILRFDSGKLMPELRLLMSGSAEKDNFSMLIGKRLAFDKGTLIVRISNGFIMWDKSLTVEEAQQAICLIDNALDKAGYRDPETGERIPFPDEAGRIYANSPAKYKAGDLKNGSAFMVMPGQDPHEVLRQFDRPEELMILENPGGGITIVRKDSIEDIQERQWIALEVMHEMEFSFSDLTDLYEEDVLKMRQEIERRLKKTKNQ